MSKETNLTPEQLETIKATFPADMPVKIFLLSSKQELVQEALREIFRARMLRVKSWNVKESSGNKYKVVSILTHLESYELMVELYNEMKGLDGVVQVM